MRVCVRGCVHVRFHVCACVVRVSGLHRRMPRQRVAVVTALRLRWRVSFRGDFAWLLRIQGSVRMVEWDDKCVARSCSRTLSFGGLRPSRFFFPGRVAFFAAVFTVCAEPMNSCSLARFL